MSDIRQPVIPRLMLDTKANIPFPAAQLTIVQPSVKDISLLGEEANFLVSVNALTKNYRAIKDNFDLSQLSNFEIFTIVPCAVFVDSIKYLNSAEFSSNVLYSTLIFFS